jgi:hypothetical protein
MKHTCSYEIGVEKEIEVSGKVYYVSIEASVEFDNEAEAQGVEVVECSIESECGTPIGWSISGRRIEKINIEGNAELTEVIENALWDEINAYSENNYRDICMEVEDDLESMREE